MYQRTHKATSKNVQGQKSRSFFVPSQHQSEQIPTAPRDASRFSHSFANIPVHHPSSETLIQPKLTIGQPDDKYEQEADDMARQVVEQIHEPISTSKKAMQSTNGFAQRMTQGLVQHQSNDAKITASPNLETSIHQMRGSGQPLAENIREPMQRAFGADFREVKIHTDARSDQLNQSIQAKAFTTGQDVFFRQGAYQPHSREGQELIAHELTHVVQQNSEVGKELQKERGETSQPQPHISAEQVIQRRAGIEYETAIPARDPESYQATVENSGWVKQDDIMATSPTGWNIVSDNSKLEFVTEPPVETDQLTDVVNNMMDVIKGLPEVLHGERSDFNTAFPGLDKTKNYTILPYKKKIVSGSLQGTVGIPFHRLYAFFDLLTKYNLQASTSLITLHEQMVNDRKGALAVMDDGPEKNKEQTKVEELEQKLESEKEQGATAISPEDIELYGTVKTLVDNAVHNLQGYLLHISDKEKKTDQQKELDKLKGLLHFVGQYAVFASRYTSSYKKKSFPIMARTSFSSMFENLPRGYQRKFIECAKEVIEGLGLKLNSNVFSNAKVDVGEDSKFTLQEWLSSIVKPVDRPVLDGESYKIVKADRMTAPGTKINRTDNSMGSMKLDNGLVVVELRTIKHFTELSTHDPESTKSIVADLAALEHA